MSSPRRYELIVTLSVSLGEAPDAAALRAMGMSLAAYAEALVDGMALGDLDDYDVKIGARRQSVDIEPDRRAAEGGR